MLMGIQLFLELSLSPSEVGKGLSLSLYSDHDLRKTITINSTSYFKSRAT